MTNEYGSISFQHPRDAAWFPVVQLPPGWPETWQSYGEITVIAPDGAYIVNIRPAVLSLWE